VIARRSRRRRVTREIAPPRTRFDDDLCSGCSGGWAPLYRLRTTRGKLLRGEWCGTCIMEKEATL